MRALYQIILDVHRIGVQATINAKQNDTESRTVKIALSEHGRPFAIPESAIAVLYATKPDGTVLFNSCVKKDGFAYYTITTQTVSALGEVLCELRIIDNDETLASPRFKIQVESVLVPDETIESTDEYTALTEALEEVGNLAASVTKEGHTATISITDKDGTETTASVTSPFVSVSSITGGHAVSITDEDGTETFNVLDGEKGADGATGADGTPGAVKADGTETQIWVGTTEQYADLPPGFDKPCVLTADTSVQDAINAVNMMAAKRGQTLFSGTAAYSTSLNISLTGTYGITDFVLVKVAVGDDEVLCSVRVDGTDAYLQGCGPHIADLDPLHITNPKCVNVFLKCENNVLTENNTLIGSLGTAINTITGIY